MNTMVLVNSFKIIRHDTIVWTIIHVSISTGYIKKYDKLKIYFGGKTCFAICERSPVIFFLFLHYQLNNDRLLVHLHVYQV